MHPVTGGRALAPMLLLSLSLAACGDGPTAPPTPSRIPPPPLASLASTVDAATGTITLWADDGIGYTLDGTRSEIRATDGYTLELTREELATALNAFAFAAEGDRLSTALASSPPPLNLDCELGLNTCNRNDMFATPPGDAPIIGAGAEDGAIDFGPAIGIAQTWGCRDIALAIHDANVNFRARRADVVSAYRDPIRIRASVADGTFRVRLSDVTGAAQRAEIVLLNHAKATVQLNVLATLYSSWHCWSEDWPGQQGSTFLPNIPGFTKMCRTETEDIELSNGVVIRREVSVCEYRMQ